VRAHLWNNACCRSYGIADLALGASVRDVLEAHIDASNRFRGIRHAAGWHASDDIRNSHSNPRKFVVAKDISGRLRAIAPLGLSFDSWLYHPQIPS